MRILFVSWGRRRTAAPAPSAQPATPPAVEKPDPEPEPTPARRPAAPEPDRFMPVFYGASSAFGRGEDGQPLVPRVDWPAWHPSRQQRADCAAARHAGAARVVGHPLSPTGGAGDDRIYCAVCLIRLAPDLIGG